MDNTQLPAEVQTYYAAFLIVNNPGQSENIAFVSDELIDYDKVKSIYPKAREVHQLTEGKNVQWIDQAGATEYASKLHQADQEITQLKRWKTEAAELLNPILDYGQSKEASIRLGESITAVVLERCKRFEQARTLLQTVYDLKLMPSTAPIIEQIKTYLDGK